MAELRQSAKEAQNAPVADVNIESLDLQKLDTKRAKLRALLTTLRIKFLALRGWLNHWISKLVAFAMTIVPAGKVVAKKGLPATKVGLKAAAAYASVSFTTTWSCRGARRFCFGVQL